MRDKQFSFLSLWCTTPPLPLPPVPTSANALHGRKIYACSSLGAGMCAGSVRCGLQDFGLFRCFHCPFGVRRGRRKRGGGPDRDDEISMAYTPRCYGGCRAPERHAAAHHSGWDSSYACQRNHGFCIRAGFQSVQGLAGVDACFFIGLCYVFQNAWEGWHFPRNFLFLSCSLAVPACTHDPPCPPCPPTRADTRRGSLAPHLCTSRTMSPPPHDTTSAPFTPLRGHVVTITSLLSPPPPSPFRYRTYICR